EATGGVHAFEFETDSCTIISNSVGDIEVDVREYLNATISNIGSIYYHGFPAIEVVDTGLGELIDDN
ncbi:MAG: DUF2807 domain-containing protein, partial [candidate division Zixibacteria bacterium]|nr:DUF2807 domain-containing protein [candidate division Zixibacteria bacterium]